MAPHQWSWGNSLTKRRLTGLSSPSGRQTNKQARVVLPTLRTRVLQAPLILPPGSGSSETTPVPSEAVAKKLSLQAETWILRFGAQSSRQDLVSIAEDSGPQGLLTHGVFAMA